MDTTYYSFETRTVKVSGGADLLCVVPAAVTAPAGEVLDFDRCRRRLETKAAWKGLAQAVGEVSLPVGADEDRVYEAVAPAAAGADFAPAAPRPRAAEPAPARRAPKVSRAKPSVPAKVSALTDKLRAAARTVRSGRAGNWLELLSSVAMLLVCVWAGWIFLALV